MNEETTNEILEEYNSKILNWLSNMDDHDKANFLYHLNNYVNEDNKISYDKLENGEYIPYLMSEKERTSNKLDSYLMYDIIFSLLSGTTILNYDKYIGLINSYNEPIKQLLLSTGYVLPPACALSCILMTIYYWYHNYLCSITLDNYQKQLNGHNQLIRTK